MTEEQKRLHLMTRERNRRHACVRQQRTDLFQLGKPLIPTEFSTATGGEFRAATASTTARYRSSGVTTHVDHFRRPHHAIRWGWFDGTFTDDEVSIAIR